MVTTSSGHLRRKSRLAGLELPPTARCQGPDNVDNYPLLSDADLAKQYIRLSQRDHILLRPDTYIGSVEQVEGSTWVVREDSLALERRAVLYSRGFLKIFDEILVNAMDQQFAGAVEIAVDVDQASGIITVSNDGRGIPVQMHEDYKEWVPTFVFGELLTGSNFDDHAGPRFVGGRNGVGAKATNVFSEWFEVEIVDVLRGRSFKQRWSQNMGSVSEPEVVDVSGVTVGKVRVRFLPDFARFGMTGIDDSTFELLRSRVIDAAACTRSGVDVKFNGVEVGVRSFRDYADLVIGAGHDADVTTAEVVDNNGTVRLEVAVGISGSSGFQAIGFVNGIRCHEGSHIDHTVKQLVEETMSQIGKKKTEALKIQPRFVKEHIFLVVKVLVENPSFESQSKEKLQTPASKFGFEANLPQKFLKKAVVQSGLAKIVEKYAAFKDKAGSKRTLERKLEGALPAKLEDAVHAGMEGHDCTLILTEGDSAKAMALGALESFQGGRGRDNFGIFPLRGKIMNVRAATMGAVAKSAELQQLMKVIGLKPGKEYDSVAAPSLRYQKIMVFADQDPDGDHITGLIINIFAELWPSILRAEPKFFVKFGTPLVKVTNYPAGTEFFSMQEWEHWAALQTGEQPVPKYYKGLGTSTDSEAAEYFQNLARHTVKLEWRGADDARALELAFSPHNASERKTWLLDKYDSTAFFDYAQDTATHRDFFDRSFIHFSMYDCQRNIPHLMDGFKPSQRKAIFAARRRPRSEMKVAAFAAFAMQATKYHHGETSMMEAVVRLAQNHVGTNNVNYLSPIGQFGSRLHDRSEHAQARYIGVRLEEITNKIFRPEDDAILNYEMDELTPVEPRHFLPVLPSVLLNGASGIGTGWSTDTLCYHPEELAEAMRQVVSGNITPQVLMPWFDRFAGEIYRDSGTGKFLSAGRWSIGMSQKTRVRTPDSVEITELPVGTWTDPYKEWLLENKALQGIVKSIDSSRTGKGAVHLVLHCEPTKLRDFLKKNSRGDKLGRALGLVKGLKSQMWLWNASDKLEFFEDTDAVIRSFYTQRLPMYEKRLGHLIQAAEREVFELRQKQEFIRHVIDGTLKLSPPPSRRELEAELQRLGLEQLSSHAQDSTASEPSYDYLLNLKFMSLTKENEKELHVKLGRKQAELEALRQDTADKCWLRDLDDFSEAYKAFRTMPPTHSGQSGSALAKVIASTGPEGTTLGLQDRVPATKKKSPARTPRADAKG